MRLQVPSLEVVFSDDLLQFSIHGCNLWDGSASLIVPRVEIGVISFAQVLLGQIDEGTDLTIVLDICNCNLVTAEELLVLKLLIKTWEKLSEELILLPA